MSIFNIDLNYENLISFNNGTLQLASFVQIRNALIKRMKEIYGEDIDVSPASADGQYVNSIALLFNNIFQTIRRANDSLDPAVATGQYLDTICSFNNIFRKEPTASTVSLYLRNDTGASQSVSRLSFFDENGIIWQWYNGGETITIPVPTAEHPYFILSGIECEQVGAISAPGANAFYQVSGLDPVTGQPIYVDTGSDNPMTQSWDSVLLYGDSGINGTITQCIELPGIHVWQYENATVGQDEETDESLRSRRYQSLGNTSVTVLESLKGSLSSIEGVKDVYIFNNPVTGDGTTILASPQFEPIADGSSLKGHSIYIAIRLLPGADLDDDTIGKTIYSKLTPGISTSPFNGTGSAKYELTTFSPSDWEIGYGNYYRATQALSTDTWAPNTYYTRDGNELTLSETDPGADWPTTYQNYYRMSLNSNSTWSSNTIWRPEESHMIQIVRTSDFSDYVYWKICSKIHPQITIDFQTNPNLYDYPADYTTVNTDHTEVEKKIISALQKKIYDTKISDYLSAPFLSTTMQQADIQKNGMPTFFVSGSSIDYGGADVTLCPANLSYFEYDESDYRFEYETGANGLPSGPAHLIIG